MDESQQNPAPLSRRQRRELNRTQHRSQQGKEALGRSMRRMLIWGGGLALLVGFGWLMVKLAGDVRLPTDSGVLSVDVSETDHVTGPADAPLTLVEYSDFQCPACGSFYPLIKQLLKEPELAGKVRFVYRNFPLTAIHPNAQLSAQAAQAAAMQGKFWEMHDMLFENQTKWSGMSSEGARGEFLKYANAMGITGSTYTRDVDSDEAKKKISDDLKGGEASGVTSTPSFYLNGTRMAHPASYEEFKKALLSHLNPTPTLDATP